MQISLHQNYMCYKDWMNRFIQRLKIVQRESVQIDLISLQCLKKIKMIVMNINMMIKSPLINGSIFCQKIKKYILEMKYPSFIKNILETF